MGRTPRGETRRAVLSFVRGRLLAGHPPTVREVQERFGFRAVQTARQHLEALVAEGALAVDRGKARGYRLPSGAQPPTVLAPLVGRIQAGPLTTAIEELEGYLPVQSRRRGEELFALRVRGESMTGIGILPGDIVVVRRQQKAESGQVVVALVGDEATVKTLRIRGRKVRLHPENPAFEPIDVDENVVILGRVVEVRRSLE